jgi:ketosteroid isomerase-like protein
MSREDVELVIRGMKAAGQRPKPDFATVNAVYAPDHVFIPFGAAILGEGEVRGGRGFKAWLDETGEVMPFSAETDGAVDVAPRIVLAASTIHFQGASSGMGLDQRIWLLVIVTDGKITRTEAYLNPAKALEALRLRE